MQKKTKNGERMFINKTKDGRNNICGRRIAALRKAARISQREFAENLQLSGLDIDKNAIQRIEAGKRFVTDIELRAMARYFGTTIDELLEAE